MFDDIEKQIRICLCIQRRPTRNALAGKGTKKYARNDRTTRMFAETIAGNIDRTYHFHDKDGRVETDKVAQLIFEVLRAMPDEILKLYADKLSINSDPALAEMAAEIHQAIAGQWAISYHPSTKPSHSSAFDGALRRWEEEMRVKE